ncbi:MAG: hypothetical protein LQ342_004206 [Letrouitia transgressa]|nr:MAG: hypothetical protein LQ342_004206 [Letrouitia transgressa]
MYGAASLIVTAILLPFIGSVSVCLRFYVRLRLKPTFIGIDDWLILFSCILVWAQGANQVVAASIGDLGRDNKDTVEWRVKVAQKAAHANLIIEKVTYTTIKLSVLLFYRRIFLHQKKFRIANDILIILVTLWGFVFLLTFAFLAGDVNSPGENWGSLWFCITEVVSDVAILALPYPCIRELQMSKRDKMGVIAIFLLGTL